MSSHDAAVWRTVWINDLIDAGRFHTIEATATNFAPHLGSDERVVASGPHARLDFIAGGDGRYLHKSGSGFFFSTRPGGMVAGAAFMAAGAAVRAAGNRSRRHEAERLAREQWRHVDGGALHVSQHGFYLHSPYGLNAWAWQYVHAAELIAPAQVVIAGQTQAGPVQWLLQSDWAELLFTLWARARHPQHPQFLDGTWVPSGWVDRVNASGYRLPQLESARWSHLLEGQRAADT